MQGEDNEHYLHYTFDGKENIAGSIFLDYRNRADFTDRKAILYGHNMQDGSMFSRLEKYQDAGFRETQGMVILYLPDKTLECEVLECRQVSIQDSVYVYKKVLTETIFLTAMRENQTPCATACILEKLGRIKKLSDSQI